MPTPAFWRPWHRWIGAAVALFLAFAAGVILADVEFVDEDTTLREANRSLVSAVTTSSPPDAWKGLIDQVMTAASKEAPNAPIDKIAVELKGTAPVITVYLGKPTGGEDKRLVFDARTGKLLRTEDYVETGFRGIRRWFF